MIKCHRKYLSPGVLDQFEIGIKARCTAEEAETGALPRAARFSVVLLIRYQPSQTTIDHVNN